MTYAHCQILISQGVLTRISRRTQVYYTTVGSLYHGAVVA